MLTKLFINKSSQLVKHSIEEYLRVQNISLNLPDVYLVEEGTKLSVEQIKKIQDFLKFKPLKLAGRVVVIEAIQDMSELSQNAFLKTIEELEPQAQILMGANNLNFLLPTFLSRIQVVSLDQREDSRVAEATYGLDQLRAMALAQRFALVEKTSQKTELLESLVDNLHQSLPKEPKLSKYGRDLLQAQQWAKANGNIRAILEYLMIRLPE